MRAVHVANVPRARVYYILDGAEGGHDGAVILPDRDPMFVNFWSFTDRKKNLKPITDTPFHKFFWDGHAGREADRWNDMFFERLIKPDNEMLTSVSIVTKFPNIKKERNNARGNHASEFKSLTAGGHHEKALGRRRRGGLGRGIGRTARGAATSVFDPKAWDGDGDGIVQERTPYERPAIPGINTNLPGMPHTSTKPADYPDDHRDPISQGKPDTSRMTRFRPEGAVGEHRDLIPMPSRRAQRMARRENTLPPQTEGLRSATSGKPYDTFISGVSDQRVTLKALIKSWLSTMKGPDNFEAKRARDRKRVDDRLNDGNPIKTVAQAKKAMVKINPGFGDGTSEADFLGKRPLELIPGTGTTSVPQARYKLGDVVFRDEAEDLTDVEQQVMYSFLANAMKSGRYGDVRWALVSSTTEIERGIAQVPGGYKSTDPKRMAAGYASYDSGTRGTWRRVGDKWVVNTDPATGRVPRPALVRVLYPDFETYPEMKDVGGDHMGPTANVAQMQFLKTMQLLEPEFDHYTPEERLAKGTDAAIDPLDPDRTKRFNRVYHRAMLNFFQAVNEHEFGHASHELAMFDDWKKKVAKDLPAGELPWDALATYIEERAIDLLDNQQKRRLVQAAALHSIHHSSTSYFQQLSASLLAFHHMAPGPDKQVLRQQLTSLFSAPILDANGNPIKRTPEMAKTLKAMGQMFHGQTSIPYPSSGSLDDIKHSTPLTRGDLFLLFGPSVDGPPNPQVQGPLSHKLTPLDLALDFRNKGVHPGRHEPWGLMQIMSEPAAGGAPHLTQQAFQRILEHGTPDIKLEVAPGAQFHLPAIPPEDVAVMIEALGRISGQVARADTPFVPELAEAQLNADPSDPVEHLATAGGMDSETLFRALLPGNHQKSLSADEIGELAKAEVGSSLKIGHSDQRLADIGAARALISSGHTPPLSDEDAEKILKELSPEGEKSKWPINLADTRTGQSLSIATNPDTGALFAEGDAIPRSLVDKMIKDLDDQAQGQVGLVVDVWGKWSQFYDELERNEIRMLKMIASKFGGERYTPYMGRRYPAVSPSSYAVDATNNEIFSELAALYYNGERIRIEVPRDSGNATKWRDLNGNEMAVVRKVMNWMYPNATRVGWTDDDE